MTIMPIQVTKGVDERALVLHPTLVKIEQQHLKSHDVVVDLPKY